MPLAQRGRRGTLAQKGIVGFMKDLASDEHQRSLVALGRRLEAKGFWFRPRAYFAPNGILVGFPPTPSAPAVPQAAREYLAEHIQVIRRAVLLYHSGESWEARVTRHGGPHWGRQADTLDELEEVALEALGTDAVPPSPRWLLV
ncbi:hypothetical protein JY651_07970 [Pyxidicoccus parkwayensis]|uniref:Uncharacterized protein n=1 Tax=Pyxidicoccus parkwayensis TaxID=2813578 RepID=A0ABX7P344_9BACT|nr:hypothetical protein [Pyxidicoccus parkwaysis]QSQ24866.1 hypothetical protein JY651_07970 [Pyxidicoccus parkwaysis]